MEQTLGKRIAENRKRLKLTQDQLAEQLGITAQAISKWENDLSCPDITMLPKLAEIFGITTDELLGVEQPQVIHEAQIVTDDADSDKGGSWEFHWDSGRSGAIALAMMVLAVGLLFLAARVNSWEVTFWEILWPCALMTFGITQIAKEFSIFSLSVLLFGSYGLLTNLGLVDWGYDGNLVFPIIVVLTGLSLLVDALKKPKKQQYWFKKDGATIYRDGHHGQPQVSCTTEDEEFECISSFGDYRQSVNLPRLSGGQVICSFGDLTVDLSGCETLGEDCEIDATCSFGQLTLLVPSKFRVMPDANSAFADVATEGHPDPDTQQIIRLEANVSFGSIRIHYI